MEQRGIQLYPHACPSQSQIQPTITPCSHRICAGVPLVCSPYPCSSLFFRCQSPVYRSFDPPQPGRRSPTPRLTPVRHQPSCADQSPPSLVEEGLGLHLPYQKHIWRLASTKTVCAWRLPSKTAIHPRTFLRLQRSEGIFKKKTVSCSETLFSMLPRTSESKVNHRFQTNCEFTFVMENICIPPPSKIGTPT